MAVSRAQLDVALAKLLQDVSNVVRTVVTEALDTVREAVVDSFDNAETGMRQQIAALHRDHGATQNFLKDMGDAMVNSFTAVRELIEAAPPPHALVLAAPAPATRRFELNLGKAAREKVRLVCAMRAILRVQPIFLA